MVEGFGDRLRRLRQAAGLSQEELAARAGLAPAAIGALERGDRRYPYPGTVQALANALQLSPSEREAFFVAVPTRPRATASKEPLHHAPPPPPLTPLVGREREVAMATGLMQKSNARLVSLTGPPGVGKTRLAIELAARLPSKLGMGVVWVELVGLPEPDLLLPELARALSLPEVPGTSTAEVLESYLARRQLMLVLDNFEHLVPAGPALADLIGRCPGLVVLVTSREGLGVRGEHQFPVAPLGLPDQESSAAGIKGSEAVGLFLQRVHSVAPGFEMKDADAPIIAAICRRLDGLPLALELAAAQLKYMSPASLLHRLERRLAVLEGGPRDVPQRQRSLRGTIEWSYDLLGTPEQVLFRRLSVFEGGFTEEAADAVCGQGGGLMSLVDKSLVQPVSSPDEAPRYLMLETLREYARERLLEAGEEAATSELHAAYYRQLAETSAPHTSGPGRGRWLQRLEIEWPNLRSALAWTLDRGDECTGLRIAGALGWFWILRGYVAEGRAWTDRLLGASREGCSSAERASAAYVAAVLAWKQGDNTVARRLVDESVELRRALGDDRALAFSLGASGLIATSEGEFDEAKALQEESLAHFRQEGEPWGIAYGLSNLGDALRSAGDLAGARRLYDEGLALFSGLCDSWGCGLVLHTLAGIDLAEGDAAGASARYTDALAHFRALGNLENVARSLIGLGAANLARDEPDEAEQSLLESLAVWRDFGFRPGIAICLEGLAAVESCRRQFRAAARLLGAAGRYRQGGASVFMVDPDVFSGYLEKARQQLDEETFAEAWEKGSAADLDSLVGRPE